MATSQRPLRILDLCCGTGAASRPYERAGWEVVRVDNDPHWRPDILADVREMAPPPGPWHVVWASPPCTAFSRADQPGLYPDEPTPDTATAAACKRLIDALAPAVWWIENVRGARPFLTPIFGAPACHLGPWWLWTNSFWLPALAERPRKTMSGYRKGTAHRPVRLAVHAAVAQACFAATCADLVVAPGAIA